MSTECTIKTTEHNKIMDEDSWKCFMKIWVLTMQTVCTKNLNNYLKLLPQFVDLPHVVSKETFSCRFLSRAGRKVARSLSGCYFISSKIIEFSFRFALFQYFPFLYFGTI